MTHRPLAGAGLGFRRELIAPLKQHVPEEIAFFELAPENWAGMGGRSGKDLRHFTERHAFVCHGLSLSLGGIAPLDVALLRRIKIICTGICGQRSHQKIKRPVGVIDRW